MSSKRPVGDTRTRILDAMVKLLRVDPAGTRMEDVARACGISRQAVYLHFPDRAALLTATAVHVDETLGLEEATRPVREASPEDILDRLAEFCGHYLPKVNPIVEAMEFARATDATLQAAFDDRARDRREGVEQIVAILERGGLLAKGLGADDAIGILLGLASVELWREITTVSKWSNDRYVAQLKRLMRRALCDEPRRAPRGAR